MKRTAIYAGTRNIYHDMLVSAKSLIANDGADEILILAEDDDIPESHPSCISAINVSNQQYFPSTGPNFSCRWTYMVMMRTALTKLLPNYDTVLSLDHDTIVRKPIYDLWNADITDYYYAAVEEKQIRNRNHPYFNFGVVLHNLRKLRQDKVDDIIINHVNTVFFPYCEQDAVNTVCKKNILELPPKFNAMRFNKPRLSDDDISIAHHAARIFPLNTFPDYQYYDNMSWDDVFRNRDEVRNTYDTI